jgi:hypothetical protein
MTISVQVLSHSPLELTYTTPLASDTITNSINFDAVFNIRNNSLSDRIIQISAVTTCDQGDYSNISEVIAADHDLTIPITSRHTNWTSKISTIRFSPSVSGLTCAAFRVLK